MEKSKDELLAGISKLSGLDPFPDEIFYQIFEIEDNVERTQYVEALRKEAGKLKRRPEFNNLYRAFVLDYSQRQKQTGKVTRFTDQPIELNCGEWEATDMGVKTVRYDKNAMPVAYYACSHPILPVEILKMWIRPRSAFPWHILSQPPGRRSRLTGPCAPMPIRSWTRSASSGSR